MMLAFIDSNDTDQASKKLNYPPTWDKQVNQMSVVKPYAYDWSYRMCLNAVQPTIQ